MDNVLEIDLLGEILLKLEEKDVNNLKRLSSDFSYFVGEVEKNQEYWRKKLSNYLDFEVFERITDWKKMYLNVIKHQKDSFEMIVLGYTEIVENLIRIGFDPSGEDNQAIILAVTFGHVRLVKLLMTDPRINPADRDNEAILVASNQGDLEIVKILLQDARVLPDDKNNSAMIAATARGCLDVVKFLLKDPRIDPLTLTELPSVATYSGHIRLVKYLLEEENMDPNPPNSSLPFLAAKEGHLELLKYLLNDSRIIFEDIERAIDSARIHKHTEIVKFLEEF